MHQLARFDLALTACALGLLGCDYFGQAPSAPATAYSHRFDEELADESCGFVKQEANPELDALVDTFLAKRAAGEFLRSSPYFRAVALCPGQELGFDAATVVRGFSVKFLSRSPTDAELEVTHIVLGTSTIEAGEGGQLFAFHSAPGKRTERLSAGKTEYGWRLINKDGGGLTTPYITPGALLAHAGARLSAADRALLERLK